MADDGVPTAALEEALGYQFEDRALLMRSLVHRSYLDENPDLSSNETLEFLGDAVLQLAVTDFLIHEYPDLPEGQLAKVRAAVVSEPILAQLAAGFGIGEAVRLGKGEAMTGGRAKNSILSDAMEAVLGALYLDAGFEAARRVVVDHWADLLRQRAEEPGRHDYKTRLQELLARAGKEPQYVIDAEGPDHERSFTATVVVDGAEVGRGVGTSKKRAQQAAAARALEALSAAD